jgi:CDP-diacylglycerol--serine O-phosphatidyltransferase
MLRPLRRSTDRPGRRLRRGVYLLPSMFTIGNMFCGYACIVHAMRGEFHIAAPFIGFAMVLDMLDGRIARMTGTSSDFGIELDSLADVISFGMAPAILSFSWGLQPLGRLGWAVGFLFVAAAALRLARFNIQAGSVDKRYFVGMPSPAAAAVPAATVFAYPYGFTAYTEAVPVIAMVLVPALLMVSTSRPSTCKRGEAIRCCCSSRSSWRSSPPSRTISSSFSLMAICCLRSWSWRGRACGAGRRKIATKNTKIQPRRTQRSQRFKALWFL